MLEQGDDDGATARITERERGGEGWGSECTWGQ